MDDIIRCVGSQQAQSHTRRKEGARTAGIRPWGLSFEAVGGEAWCDALSWAQAGWKSFVRTLLMEWQLQHLFEYVILPGPQPWRLRNQEEEEEEEEESQGKNDKIAKRLALNFENASAWNCEAKGIPIELHGDSQ
eukprot:8365107-Pyramimonas_sp.AAC.1